jgi:hypothetical protein
MQLLVFQCCHHLKFLQRACLPKHRTIYTRLSSNRPFSPTPTTNLPSSSMAELAPTKNTTRTVTSSVSPPEEPVSPQKDTFGRPQSSEVASTRVIINPRSPATQFGIIAGMFLRHTARSLGFLVLPDGYMRVSDMVNIFPSTRFWACRADGSLQLSYTYFGQFKFLEFARFVKNDPMNRFEMALLPDLVDGTLQKVWWVRAKYGHTIPVRCPHISSYLFIPLRSPLR